MSHENPEQYTPEHIFLHAWNLITATNHRILAMIFRQFGSFETAWKHITRDQLSALSKDLPLVELKHACDPAREWSRFMSTVIQWDGESKLNNTPALKFILHTDPDYPPLLKQLTKAHFGLYVLGKISAKMIKTNKFISIVGTRRASPYGTIQTQKIIQSLATVLPDHELIVVSGLADGIDTIAHESALLENFPTWAILGHGHHHLRRYKHSLANEIIGAGGAIISEYPPDTPPEKYRYPERNHIIAGLSPVTLVTEAPASSGANITAKIAFEENREVFALTADIDRDDCAGNLDLIERHTAAPLVAYKQLYEALGIIHHISAASRQPSLTLHNPSLQKIIDTLTHKHATPISQIFESVQPPTISLLLQHLTELEIEGLIEQVGGGYRLKK